MTEARVQVMFPFAEGQLRFFMTAAQACPYLPGQWERKVFAHLPLTEGPQVNDALTRVGFRRSQNIAYRPACEGCDACISARLPVADYRFSRSERKTLNRNADLTRQAAEAEATAEQYDLLRRYLAGRHPGGGMSDMGWADYVTMVEDSAARSHLVEYRLPSPDGGPGDLIACALVDDLEDGLSLVYSFYDPEAERRSLGSFVILDHVAQAAERRLPFVYLGYWVPGSRKMAYKVRFDPVELLGYGGWRRMTPDQRAVAATIPMADAPAITAPPKGLPSSRDRLTVRRVPVLGRG